MSRSMDLDTAHTPNSGVELDEVGEDLGSCRLISRGKPKLNISRLGITIGLLYFVDLYHTLLNMSWWRLWIVYTLYFVSVHTLFGLFYFIDYEGVGGIEGDTDFEIFAHCCYFSLQTMDTIGYGRMYPVSHYVNTVVMFQSYISTVATALITGLAFMRMARPYRAAKQILFSKVAVINHSYNSVFTADTDKSSPCFAFRVVNMRKTQVLNTQFKLLYLSRDIPERERSLCSYKIYELDFDIYAQGTRVRKSSLSRPCLGLPWTIVHKMDQNSPLYGQDKRSLKKGEFIAILEGVDESTSNQIQARWSYVASEILWDETFEPMVRTETYGPEGTYVIDFTKLHSTRPSTSQ